MFIYSVRASSIKLFSVIAVCVLGLMIAVFGTVSAATVTASTSVSYNGIKDDAARRAFIAAQGYTVAEGCKEEVKFTVPEDFDRVIAGYNEIQKKQGLDIGRYKGKTVTRYTYEITNYEGYDGTVLVNLIVYRSRIVACDVSSASPDGFIAPLVRDI